MPPSADTAALPKRQTRRAAARIVPAIPLALTRPPRSARPITPEEIPSSAAASQQDVEPPQATEKEEATEEQPIQEPLTPNSKNSALNGEDMRTESATSPATSSANAKLEEPHGNGDHAAEGYQDKTEDVASRFDLGPTHNGTAKGEHYDVVATEPPSPSYPPEQPPASAQTPTLQNAGTVLSPPSSHTPSHIQHSSLDGIVFGTTQDSPGNSSAPQEVDLDTRMPPQIAPRHPPGFVRPEYAVPFYPGHSHHPSETQAPWIPPPVAAARVDDVYTPVQELHQPPPPAQVSYQGQFSPHGASNLNGTARSHSQSPVKSSPGGTKPGSEKEETLQVGPYQNGTGLSPFTPEPKFEEPFQLATYLSLQFGNPEFADFILRVRSEEAALLTMPVHGIVVARSQTIAAAIVSVNASKPRHQSTPTPIDVFSLDRCLSPQAVGEAIRVLYGAPLLSTQRLLYGLVPYHPDVEHTPVFRDAQERMSQAISYTAAGNLFQLRNMSQRGCEIIRLLLRWDTVDQAVSYALDESAYARGRTRPAHPPASPDEFLAGDFLENACVDFIAYHFPVSFTLSAIAPEMQRNPRLPNSAESRPPSHNPRLSRIRFGDVPPEDELQPDYITRVLSSVLLTVPVTFLDRLFNHRVLVSQHGWSAAEKIMRDVVSERERRRQKTLNSQIRPSQAKDGLYPKFVLDNVFYEEQMARSREHPSGYTLIETRALEHV